MNSPFAAARTCLLLSALGFTVLISPSVGASEWERFGDWQVKALHDEMDTTTRVRLFTEFHESDEDRYKRVNFEEEKKRNIGFEIFGGHVVTLSPSYGFIARGYWPFCEMDASTVSVDGSKAIRVSTVGAAGECARVTRNGELIRQFKAGSSARMRIGREDGSVSLKGFAAAWDRALQLGK